MLNNKNYVLGELGKQTMYFRGKNILLSNIDKNYNKFLNILQVLQDNSLPIDGRIDACTGAHSQYGIPQCGLFFISELLAALFQMEYTVVQPDAIKSMQRFQLTDINFGVNHAREYLYFNQLCKDLFT